MSVDFEVEDGVAVISINRPEARNAVDRETALAVEAAVRKVNQDTAIRCAVITGTGGNFCAGMDLKAFLRGEVIDCRIPASPVSLRRICKSRLSPPLRAMRWPAGSKSYWPVTWSSLPVQPSSA